MKSFAHDSFCHVGRIVQLQNVTGINPLSSVMSSDNYQLVRLANGTFSIHSLAEKETFHPVVGPVAEALALYINQLKLRQRMQGHTGEFVIWDVGLGAGGNVLTVFSAT